ncbi:MAG: carbon storage regulator [Myxococcota bacterium]
MLTLTRRPGERIVIGDGIEVEVLSVQGGRARLGIRADRSTPVVRGELLDRVLGQNLEASTEAQGPPTWRPPANLPTVRVDGGLYGMPDLEEWVVCELADAVEGARFPLRLFVAVKRPTIRLLLADLLTIRPDYPIDQAARAAGVNRSRAVLAGVVTAPAEGPCTINLAAPIVIDLAVRRGRQVILSDGSLGVDAPFEAAQAPPVEAHP